MSNRAIPQGKSVRKERRALSGALLTPNDCPSYEMQASYNRRKGYAICACPASAKPFACRKHPLLPASHRITKGVIRRHTAAPTHDPTLPVDHIFSTIQLHQLVVNHLLVSQKERSGEHDKNSSIPLGVRQCSDHLYEYPSYRCDRRMEVVAPCAVSTGTAVETINSVLFDVATCSVDAALMPT